jgi:hypothetical protein
VTRVTGRISTWGHATCLAALTAGAGLTLTTCVGRRLEAAWAGRLEAIAAELAEHFDRADGPVRSIPHHQRPAAKALRRAANEEAIEHLQRALDAVGHIANDTERGRIEVELLIALGAAFIAIRGFGAPEVLEAYSRTESLCERLGERADTFPALWGQSLFRIGRSRANASRRVCERLLTLAEKSGDAGLKLPAISGCEQMQQKSLYSMTSSARASTVAGSSRPSSLAVFRLITSSYFTGACTGKSAGFSPLRMRST